VSTGEDSPRVKKKDPLPQKLCAYKGRAWAGGKAGERRRFFVGDEDEAGVRKTCLLPREKKEVGPTTEKSEPSRHVSTRKRIFDTGEGGVGGGVRWRKRSLGERTLETPSEGGTCVLERIASEHLPKSRELLLRRENKRSFIRGTTLIPSRNRDVLVPAKGCS